MVLLSESNEPATREKISSSRMKDTLIIDSLRSVKTCKLELLLVGYCVIETVSKASGYRLKSFIKSFGLLSRTKATLGTMLVTTAM